jgi:hypothetical protein
MRSFLFELWQYMRRRKRYWLLPVIVVLVAMAGLILAASGSALAPLIYTLF